MKKTLLSILFIGIALILSSCDRNPAETQPNIDEQTNQESKEIEQPIKQEITAKDESEDAKDTLITFFDYLDKNEFEKATSLFSLDSQFTPLEEFAQGNNEAEVLENYCKATGTCLKAKVLEVKQIANYEYSLVVQFLNNDGTTYIFGPCCGATEQEMPSKDRFDYIVKKINNMFKVITPPLYRP